MFPTRRQAPNMDQEKIRPIPDDDLKRYRRRRHTYNKLIAVVFIFCPVSE